MRTWLGRFAAALGAMTVWTAYGLAVAYTAAVQEFERDGDRMGAATPDDDLMAVADAVQDDEPGDPCDDPNRHVLTGCTRCRNVLQALADFTGRTNFNLEFVKIVAAELEGQA